MMPLVRGNYDQRQKFVVPVMAMLGVIFVFLGLWIGDLTNYASVMLLGALISIIGMGIILSTQQKTYQHNRWMRKPWNK